MPTPEETRQVPEIPAIPLIAPIDPIAPIAPVLAQQPVQARQPAPTRRRSAPAKLDPFFQPAVSDSDPFIARGGMKTVTLVQPIVDGIAILAEMEKAVGEAKSSVLIVFWFFDAGMPLQNASGTAKTWLDLIIEAAKRNVKVRLVISDFDPVFYWTGHRDAWKNYFKVVEAAKAANLQADALEVVCSRHSDTIPAKTIQTVQALIQLKGGDLSYAKIVSALNDKKVKVQERIDRFNQSPGIWDKITLDNAGASVKLIDPSKTFPIQPGTHHQKLLILDGIRAFTGGLNIGKGYADPRQHDKLKKPWHDLFVKVEGKDILEDFVANYVGLWNRERGPCKAFLDAAFAARKGPTLAKVVGATTALDSKTVTAAAATGNTPKIAAQVRRTLTIDAGHEFGAPKVLRQDILDGYLQAIKQAEEFLYFENQYYREKALFDAILERRKTKKSLKVLMLLPKVIEEADGVKMDPLTGHGANLQFNQLVRLRGALKDDLGLYAMERPDGTSVYVHSKLLIVDDTFASIGSANSNPRSYRLDTELDVVWKDPTTVRSLRLDLWNEILGKPKDLEKWKPKDFVKKWDEIAKARFNLDQAAKKGFLILFSNILEGADLGKREVDLFT